MNYTRDTLNHMNVADTLGWPQCQIDMRQTAALKALTALETLMLCPDKMLNPRLCGMRQRLPIDNTEYFRR
jgi:hypothetical protein